MARYRIRDVARDEDNNAIVGGSVSLRRELDNVEIDNTTTGADGSFGFLEEEINYPGPLKTIVTALDGVVRQTSGKNTGQVGTFFVSDLMRAFLMMTDGVVQNVDDDLEVSASGASMDVAVAPGMAFVAGHPSYWPDGAEVTPAANGTGNPRIDLVVIRLQMPGTSEEGKQEITLVQGTPAASPVAPGVTQDPNTVWELALGEVTVPAGAATISGGNIADARTYTSGPLMDGSVVTAKLADGAVTTAKLADENVTAAKLTAEANVSTADIAKVLKAPLVASDPPAYSQLSIRELSDVQDAAPTGGQVLTWDATDGRWEPTTPSSITLVVQEGDVTTVAQAATLDFTAAPFAVTESPTGEANIDIAASGIDTTRIADGAVTNAKVASAIDAVKIGDGSVSNTEFQRLNGVTSDIQTQLDDKADAGHTHTITNAGGGKATKSYTFSGVTSTAADGVEVAGFDLDVPAGGGYVQASADAQASAPSAGGSYIELGVKIGSQSTEWGMRTQTVGGERHIAATSDRTYTSGASSQRISLRARVDAGSGAGLNSANIRAILIPRTDTES